MAPRPPHPLRALSIAALAGAVVLGALAFSRAPQPQPTGSDDLAADLNRRLTQDVAPLLATYCLKCHSGDKVKGDVHLDRLTSVKDALTGDLDLRLLKEVLGAGTMPPKDKPQPSEHERLILSQWADSMLAYVPPDAARDALHPLR